jgi:hypothetical protein
VPLNDNLANAIAIATPTAPGIVAVGDSTSATLEGGENSPSCQGTTGATVWYSWLSPGSPGTAVLDTWGTGFDTVVAVYTGFAFPLTSVACNDDNTVALGTLTALSFGYAASTTYQIQFGGYSAATGPIVLNMSLGAAIYPNIGALEINQVDANLAVVEATLLASGGTGPSGLNRVLQAGEAARVLNASAAGSGADLIHFNPVTFPPSTPAQVTTSGLYEELNGNNDTMSGVGAGVIIDGVSKNFYRCVTINGNGNHIEGIQLRNCSGTSTDGLIVYGSNNVIGGTLIPAQRNLIYQNATGLEINGAGNVIVGNYIGTDPTGTVARPNTEAVLVVGGGNTIGGSLPGQGNVISGNTNFGLKLTGGGNVVRGNTIGLNAALSGPLSNGSAIEIVSPGNVIGGIPAGEANKIAYSSSSAGVTVVGAGATGNTIRGNSVHSNSGSGIDNASGGNLELSAPDIGSVTAGQVQGLACPNCTVDVYNDSADEGRIYLASATANGSGAFVATISGYSLGFITATATDAGGNTSEFSAAFVAPPNADGDGLPDSVDGCPNTAEDYDQWEDGDGCPDADNDGDGICDQGQASVSCAGSDFGRYLWKSPLPVQQDCRNVAEDIDSFHDNDGCPEPDNDYDNFPDAADDCPATDTTAGPDGIADTGDEPVLYLTPVQTREDFDGVLDNDGCHDSPGDDYDLDGYSDENEALKIGTNPAYSCGFAGWPSDLLSTGLSANKLDVQDIISFIAPLRRLDTSPPGPPSNYLARWDLAPGPNVPFPSFISIFDITTMLNGTPESPAYPPMFGGPRAFGKECPFPP